MSEETTSEKQSFVCFVTFIFTDIMNILFVDHPLFFGRREEIESWSHTWIGHDDISIVLWSILKSMSKQSLTKI